MINPFAHHYFGYIIIGTGFFASNIISKLIICTLTEKVFEPLQIEVIGAIFLAALMLVPIPFVQGTAMILFFHLLCGGV